jgi:membrane protease YdiL (CAAX protease family)
MMKKPLIKQGWLRALLFLLVLTLLMALAALYLQPFLLSSGIVPKLPAEDSAGGNISSIFIALTISSLISYLLVWFFRKTVDRSTVSSLGFEWTGYQSHAITGFLLGPLLIGFGTFIFILLKKLEWVDLQSDMQPVLLTMGMMIIIAFAEELVFRGYILNNLMQSMNKWIALLLSALVFSLFHSNNPGISTLPLLNLFLGGLLLGINYIYTKNLWFGILLHFTWKFYQGTVLGYGVSGLALPSLAQHQRTGSEWLTGGVFGFEGSVVCAVICVLTLIFLAWTYEKKSVVAQK